MNVSSHAGPQELPYPRWTVAADAAKETNVRSLATPFRFGLLRVTVTTLALTAALLSGGCAFHTAREARKAAKVGFISGTVNAPGGTADTYVLLYAIGKDDKVQVDGIADLTDLMSTWSFMCTAGDRFVVGAFKDLNANGVRDAGEPAGYLGVDGPIELSARVQLRGLSIALDRAIATSPRFPLDVQAELSGRMATVRFSMGQVVTLDDPRFDPKKASGAVWAPLQAVRTTGVGVFFLQPYDPKRIPVLFVHGIGGVPKDFSVMIERLDKKRYQPWVFHYPTGFRLESPAAALTDSLPRLREQLGFKTVYVVAHSMGGLVALRAILDLRANPKHRDMVGLYLSAAAPYQGHSAVKWGLRLTPEPVPSWVDLEPGSAFLETLRRPLPAHVPFYLFFSFRRGNNPLLPMSSDSVVPVESQLPLWAQREAVRAWGFDCDHMGVLTEDGPVSVFLEILDRVTAGKH
jgi:pimeloyl-ACP methyl ester carboxylesterase